MASYPRDLMDAALKLSPEARAALAEDILDTVDPEAIDAAWRQEVDARLDRMDRGEGRSIPWEEARRHLLGSVPRT